MSPSRRATSPTHKFTVFSTDDGTKSPWWMLSISGPNVIERIRLIQVDDRSLAGLPLDEVPAKALELANARLRDMGVQVRNFDGTEAEVFS